MFRIRIVTPDSVSDTEPMTEEQAEAWIKANQPDQKSDQIFLLVSDFGFENICIPYSLRNEIRTNW